MGDEDEYEDEDYLTWGINPDTDFAAEKDDILGERGFRVEEFLAGLRPLLEIRGGRTLLHHTPSS
jgi:hypothetical protein